ncbi:peptide chain release factor N(5)-glutamine methyltransferase [Akkermansiaceae bacterium]|nr:peptide chain release factor N(5)-glutamine methyltransferase [Akkermansiaceae bacterium]MDB4541445.1 peptide chain release factor N(5)-glutamine methyltransferase [Akkermansiaceae bacterium]
MTTILDVLEKGAQFLDSKGISEARLNIEHLVAHKLECKRMDLYLRFDEPLSEDILKELRSILKIRSQNTPLQHIIGVIHFYSHDFKSDKRALIPRPESEELVELAVKADFPTPARILDLGCGSGVLGITIAKALGTKCEQLVLADLSTDALSLAKENAEALEVEAEFIETDLFSAITGTFDLIVANLPYIGETERTDLSPEVLHDPEMALFSGQDGLDLLCRFAAECSAFLNSGGLVALEVGHQQGQAVADLLSQAGLSNCEVKSDLSGIARFPIARK